MNWAARHSPPGIGGVDATSRRSREASFNGADGVVENGTLSKERILKHFVNPNHPVCAAAVASHLFLDGAATPPVSGGEFPACHSFTPFIDRAGGWLCHRACASRVISRRHPFLRTAARRAAIQTLIASAIADHQRAALKTDRGVAVFDIHQRAFL